MLWPSKFALSFFLVQLFLIELRGSGLGIGSSRLGHPGRGPSSSLAVGLRKALFEILKGLLKQSSVLQYAYLLAWSHVLAWAPVRQRSVLPASIHEQ